MQSVAGFWGWTFRFNLAAIPLNLWRQDALFSVDRGENEWQKLGKHED